MEIVTELDAAAGRALVHVQGWQSWSPSTTYRLGAAPYRPAGENQRVLANRPDRRPEPGSYWAEGLLAVDPGDGGPVTVVAASRPTEQVPSIAASFVDGRLVVSADGEVEIRRDSDSGGIDGALARWADTVALRLGLGVPRPAPTTWCSWYQYYTEVTESDVDDNMAAMDELELPVDVVQVDDGYQAEIGDWLVPSGRFRDVPGLFARITDRGRGAGIWTAPFLVGARSQLAAQHPDWLVKDEAGAPVWVGNNWGQDLYALDTTHPGAADYLRTVFTTFAKWGIGFHKIDFIFAGAVPGRRFEDVSGAQAYRRGVELIRSAIGESAYLLGCGAPQLLSIGLVDAMRVSPDIAAGYEPGIADISQPSQHGAVLNGVSRAFQHGRFWVNDPDCIMARPGVERREDWAAHVGRFGGLRSSSDGLRELDDWGLATTRQLLSDPVPRHFIPS